jgi:hypothetical protein
MKTTKTLLLACILLAGLGAAAETPSSADQINAAVLAAPEERREAAAVLGYDSAGKLVTLREGTNDMVCLADDPEKDKFSAACYHRELEPYMARGRELAAEGVAGQKNHDIRWKEIEDGKLAMPREPRTLYVLTGGAYDSATGKVVDSYLRWVIYTPFATPESTGLSTKAAPGAPWLMFPGTAGAHIMINPPRN